MSRKFILLPLLLVPALSGCIASMAADVITAPIKVVSKTADVLTTSQSEADRNRGREIRKQEEREAKEAKKRAKEERKAAEEDSRGD
jgi:predicted Holliday junction resolvase-like endonuclease